MRRTMLFCEINTNRILHVDAQGGVSLVNHPNWDWALTEKDIPSARGANGLKPSCVSVCAACTTAVLTEPNNVLAMAPCPWLPTTIICGGPG